MMITNTIKVLTAINILVFMALAYIHHEDSMQNNAFLLKTYDAESHIMRGQLIDTMRGISEQTAAAYQEGFDAGKTQTAVSFLHNNSVANYTDGYHAAISQFGEAHLSAEETDLIRDLENDLKALKAEKALESALLKAIDIKQTELTSDE